MRPTIALAGAALATTAVVAPATAAQAHEPYSPRPNRAAVDIDTGSFRQSIYGGVFGEVRYRLPGRSGHRAWLKVTLYQRGGRDAITGTAVNDRGPMVADGRWHTYRVLVRTPRGTTRFHPGWARATATLSPGKGGYTARDHASVYIRRSAR
jgi:hypothetical protein